MAIAFLNRARGSTRAFDTDVLAWRDAVVANGGSISLARLVVVDQFVFSEKAAGLWTLTDDYLGFWAENAAQALTSLKQRRLATAVNSPTFTADRDYTFNGTTSYIDTGFIPGSHGVSMSTHSVHIETYERTDVGSNSVSAGCSSSGSRGFSIRPRVAGNASMSANSGSSTYTLPVATSLALTQTGRSGTLVTDVYGAKNGVDMVRTADPGTVGSSLPDDAVIVGGLNGSGVPASFRAASIGFVAFGAALSEAQRAVRYANVQAWATATGAQV
jgi:hypothetical protein